MNLSSELGFAGISALLIVVVYLVMRSQTRQRLETANQSLSRLVAKNSEMSRRLEGEHAERQRLQEVEAAFGTMVARLPQIIRELMECSEVRDVPDKSLDLIEEIFLPRYVALFCRSGDAFVTTHSRGDSPFALRQRIGPQEGVVGWAAAKQLVLTPEDAASETGATKATYFSKPPCEFDFCIPITVGTTTTIAILVGPTRRNIPAAVDFARAIGILTTQALRSIRAIAQQKRLSTTDGLTGLLNRDCVEEFLRGSLLPDAPAGPVGVFLFDVDHFRHYNERNGHGAGDALLRALAEVLRKFTREGGILGRYGGDEFLLMMPGASKGAALRAAERVRAAIASRPFRLAETQPLGCISISGGVSAVPEDGTSAEDLLAAAEQALREAKRGRGNRVIASGGAVSVMDEDNKPETDDDATQDSILLLEELVLGEE